MMLTVSMIVSHLYQNLEIVKGVRNLKEASEGVNYCDKRTKSLCRRPPGLGCRSLVSIWEKADRFPRPSS